MPIDSQRLVAVVRLVNGWSPSARRAAVDDDPDVRPDLGQILRQLDLSGPAPTSTALANLAEQLYVVFAATDSQTRLAQLNALVSSARLRPLLADDGLEWTPAGGEATLRTASVSALVEHWTSDPSLERLTVCTGYHCADALVDSTQANNRRYCSLTCQNRTKTRNRRARLRDQQHTR